jgi:hypothetical protein
VKSSFAGCARTLRTASARRSDNRKKTGEKREQYQLLTGWKDVYDIRYIVDREKRYLGAELMVAGGGPNIWVNLDTKYVEGYWGGDKVEQPFTDNLDLDGYCEEMYGC